MASALNPFLHVSDAGIYDPLGDRSLADGAQLSAALRSLVEHRSDPDQIDPAVRRDLETAGWLREANLREGRAFRLKYVSLEGHTTCNQACWFCPVSVAPRAPHFMPLDLYRRIVGELGAHRATLEAVFMINYNEPTSDPRFLDLVAILREAQLPVAVLTNGTGLTPSRTDALAEMGGIRFLSVNLSTLDAARYERDRGADHLALVLRNLDHLGARRIATQMDLVVLGSGDETHLRDHAAISKRFAGSSFDVKLFAVMDRCGRMPHGNRPSAPRRLLRGCDNVGSRPLQHLHVTPHGKCVLCCEDYDERWVVGDLNHSSVDEVLVGEPMAQVRRWVYGIDEAPADFICRSCIFALTADE